MGATSLTLTPPDAEWMTRAACRGRWRLTDAESELAEKLAKELCASCPVWERCRAWTLSLPPRQDVHGVAGGLTEKQRDQARRRNRRSRPPGDEPAKECTGCGETKAANQFYMRPKLRGGRESRCNVCCSAANRGYREAKKAREKAAVAS